MDPAFVREPPAPMDIVPDVCELPIVMAPAAGVLALLMAFP